MKKSGELSKLVDELGRVESQIKTWFDENIRARLAACTTANEVHSIMREVSYQCRDRDGQVRDMPSSISMEFCLKLSVLIE